MGLKPKKNDTRQAADAILTKKPKINLETFIPLIFYFTSQIYNL